MVSQFIPPWQDKATLAKHICASDVTIDTWVAKGILPPPRKRGGKMMWKWSEVDERLTIGGTPDDLAKRIMDGSRRATAESQQGH